MVAVSLLLIACDKQERQVGFAESGTDSLRWEQGLQWRKEQKYTEALKVLDTLVRAGEGSFVFPAIRQMMALYTLSGQREKGEEYFLERSRSEKQGNEYRRELLIAAAQLAFEADRDSVALKLLREAQLYPAKEVPERLLFFIALPVEFICFVIKRKNGVLQLFRKPSKQWKNTGIPRVWECSVWDVWPLYIVPREDMMKG